MIENFWGDSNPPSRVLRPCICCPQLFDIINNIVNDGAEREKKSKQDRISVNEIEKLIKFNSFFDKCFSLQLLDRRLFGKS